MKETYKVFIISLGTLIFFSGLSFILSLGNQPPLAAQTASLSPLPRYSSLSCDEPIPLGELPEETVDFMNEVYKEYQETHDNLSVAIPALERAVAELLGAGEEVCDFSKCQPQVAEVGLDVTLEVAETGTKLLEANLPRCQIEECSGNPCPDLDKYQEQLKAAAGGLAASYDTLTDLLANATIPATEDIRKPGESKGVLITKLEAIWRKLGLVRWLLHPYAGPGKRSCTLTALERKKVARGEMGARFPMKCTEALEQGIYWPRPWSENCQEECPEGPTEDCRACLGNDPGSSGSLLAKINYKIYGVCRQPCQEELTEECLSCLCTENGAPLSEEACTAWLCGGNYYNWVCCHETALEIVEGEALPTTPPEIPPTPPSGEECAAFCPSPFSTPAEKGSSFQKLADCYKVPHPAQRAPQLEALLNCIENEIKRNVDSTIEMPAEGSSDCVAGGACFYGSIFTYDHGLRGGTYDDRRYACNFTRGQALCGEDCTHEAFSCHYAGHYDGLEARTKGSLAVDFGLNPTVTTLEDNIVVAIKNAAKACGVPDERILAHGEGVNFHLHISHPDCRGAPDETGIEQ